MDIAIARTFLEVVRTGSFINAAANLHITQTAVSARIRVLEEQLGRPVFVRDKAGARMTAAGERFLRFATSLVQVWESARRAVALPEGFDSVVTVGAEFSLWNPLLLHWLSWTRRHAPHLAVRARVDGADRLLDQVQSGLLDAAVIYGGARRTGIITELLFEEKLVLVRTPGNDEAASEQVGVWWGEEFAAFHQAAYPDQANPVIAVDHGPLALEYILSTGGRGYFREGFIRLLMEAGQLLPVPDSPEFSYSAYLAHSPRADPEVMIRIRAGLRAAAATMGGEALG
ncbi:LysR family transcriptional regulator [Novosphingobium nitrogenifigens]|nr:LysR family transcriptional regulator [Novosphingobium nitrogenifigens]